MFERKIVEAVAVRMQEDDNPLILVVTGCDRRSAENNEGLPDVPPPWFLPLGQANLQSSGEKPTTFMLETHGSKAEKCCSPDRQFKGWRSDLAPQF